MTITICHADMPHGTDVQCTECIVHTPTMGTITGTTIRDEWSDGAFRTTHHCARCGDDTPHMHGGYRMPAPDITVSIDSYRTVIQCIPCGYLR